MNDLTVLRRLIRVITFNIGLGRLRFWTFWHHKEWREAFRWEKSEETLNGRDLLALHGRIK
jgi:hypothetical protein